MSRCSHRYNFKGFISRDKSCSLAFACGIVNADCGIVNADI